MNNLTPWNSCSDSGFLFFLLLMLILLMGSADTAGGQDNVMMFTLLLVFLFCGCGLTQRQSGRRCEN